MTTPTPAQLAEARRIVAEAEAAEAQAFLDLKRSRWEAKRALFERVVAAAEGPLRRIAERHEVAPEQNASLDVDCEAGCSERRPYLDWPCPDFRDVAAAVGVEVPDA